MLTAHRAERTDVLAAALADILAEPLADPFTPEIVAVPAKGVERWLAQTLSARLGTSPGESTSDASHDSDGIAANIDFASPAELTERVLAAVRGHLRRDDPWSAARMQWLLIDVLDACADDPACAVLARHLGVAGSRPDPHRVGRRWSTATDLARLFGSYASARPTMIADWAAGRDTDGHGAALPEDMLWQVVVWRALRDRIGSPSPAERLPTLCEQIAAESDALDLPPRLSLFGPTRLTTEQIAVIRAVAVHRDVHLFLPHPSDRLWSSPPESAEVVRRRDLPRTGVSNPLLAGLSREIRETRLRLAPHLDRDVHHAVPDALGRGDTVLTRLQRAIRDDTAPVDLPVGPVDDSVAVHACHGPARQVEVMRDVLARIFCETPDLEPRDVIVMCPDIEAYAPLIRAAFGRDGSGHPAHGLRVRLADRSMAATNTVLDALVAVVGFAGGRATSGEILDLAAREPVRARFGFGDDDLETIGEWISEAGVRWGIGDAQRAAFGLRGYEQNTMSAGLDRIALGVVADESSIGWIHRALPLSGIDSADIDLVGRFAEFVDRLDRCLTAMSGGRTVQEWGTALLAVIDDLTDVRRTDTWQRAQAVDVVGAALEHGDPTTVLRRGDVVALLDDVVAARPTRANFRTGELTVCTMVPMRAVPHRVVVLIGLDDDTYPRATRDDGDDITRRDPCVGERDPRSEDRQLLLDTIMSVRERLVICYSGADPVSGLRRPPSVPVSEIVDAVAAIVGSDDPTSLVHRHPLHAFDPGNFAGADPFSFDVAALAGARALTRPPDHRIEFDRHPLTPVPRDDIDVADLITFFDHPVRGFCRQRLGFVVPDTDDVPADQLDAALDPLDRWGIGDRLLRRRLSGESIEALRATELRRGTLPPFALGQVALADVLDDVERLAVAAQPMLDRSVETVDIDVTLTDGRRLVGSVGGVHADPNALTVFRAHYSRLGSKHRLQNWIALLAVAASRPGPVEAVAIGRAGRGSRLARSTVQAPTDPVAALGALIALRDNGLSQPLPLPASAAAVYADRRHGGSDHDDGIEAARKDFGDRFGDVHDRHLRLVFADGFDEILATTEPVGFARAAATIWRPLLTAERIDTPR
ncbi:exodeoxyribonuclease V subunit gamma [Williamsia sp. MIQD14]|uniref:exodeoxyribonuclease V subunit gamma n=1 Tax=Williamsia sp. MIQD14 TaxID=3425703 RepID=UPI003DA06FAC